MIICAILRSLLENGGTFYGMDTLANQTSGFFFFCYNYYIIYLIVHLIYDFNSSGWHKFIYSEYTE